MSTDATIRSLYRIHIDMLGVYRRCHQACRRLRILPTVIPTPTCMAKRSLARAILLGYIDVDPERRSPRYHETCLALEGDQRVLKKAARRYVMRENVGFYGTVFYLKNPTPPGAAHATSLGSRSNI